MLHLESFLPRSLATLVRAVAATTHSDPDERRIVMSAKDGRYSIAAGSNVNLIIINGILRVTLNNAPADGFYVATGRATSELTPFAPEGYDPRLNILQNILANNTPLKLTVHRLGGLGRSPTPSVYSALINAINAVPYMEHVMVHNQSGGRFVFSNANMFIMTGTTVTQGYNNVRNLRVHMPDHFSLPAAVLRTSAMETV